MWANLISHKSTLDNELQYWNLMQNRAYYNTLYDEINILQFRIIRVDTITSVSWLTYNDIFDLTLLGAIGWVYKKVMTLFITDMMSSWITYRIRTLWHDVLKSKRLLMIDTLCISHDLRYILVDYVSYIYDGTIMCL